MHKRRIGFIVAGIIAALAVAAALVLLFGLSSADKPTLKTPTAKAITLAKNNSANDGDVQFVLQEYTCGLARIGDDVVYSDAKGQYCTVTVGVTNNTDKTLALTSLDQQAMTSDGKVYGGDAVALYYVGNDSWYDAIASGKTSKGEFVFDIPSGATISKFVFHAGVKTDGATIVLP